MSEEQALGVGVNALSFLANDHQLLSRFLELSGLTVEQLRREAERPAFFAGILDFLMNHEPSLEAFLTYAALQPADVTMAREALSNSFGTVPS